MTKGGNINMFPPFCICFSDNLIQVKSSLRVLPNKGTERDIGYAVTS
jgi:hypothetical protein